MKIHYIFLLLVLVSSQLFQAANIQISGFVKDYQTGEMLIGANVWDVNHKAGVSTDNHGYFSFKVIKPCLLNISYVGYKTKILMLNATTDTLLVLQLVLENNLNEVTVNAIRKNNFDITRLSAKELQQIPSLGGKPDVIKALQLLPGVQTQSEGMSLMLVRGGDPGQNQYLLDNVPLTYVNHLGGLMSVFNPDMINIVDFYKGNFPARQGGKLSSIVDITQREGDISKHQGSFSIGITDVSFTFEGPLINKKMSYIVTARKTLVDGLLALVSGLSDANNAIVSYGFHDINAKVTWKPNSKNNLSLNLYQGDDYLNYWGKPWKLGKNESNHIVQKWGNWMLSGHWNRMFGLKLYAENILSFNRYRNLTAQQYGFDDEGIKKKVNKEVRSSVQDFSLRSAWKYSLHRNWYMNFGGQASYLNYEPSYIYSSISTTPVLSQLLHSFETALYLDNKINVSSSLQFQPSIRYTNFINEGVNIMSFEPRVNITYNISSMQSLNLNYMKVSQNSHLIFAPGTIVKTEIWLPASSTIKPQSSDQIAMSWNGNLNNNSFSTELSLYYKKMKNLATLKEGYENILGITEIEKKLETGGNGIAYGAEFTLRKNTGYWTGSASYTWSHSTRQYANINSGNTYEYDFNRQHSINFIINRKLTKTWDMNVVWQFQTGIPYTPALGKQNTMDTETGQQTNVELIYGNKNSARMQPYHRLDVGFSHAITTKRGNDAVWTYSIYNIYNRINPYNYYYDNDNDLSNLTSNQKPLNLYKVGLFSIIPSISYKVSFNYKKHPQKKFSIKQKKTAKPKLTSKQKIQHWLYFD